MTRTVVISGASGLVGRALCAHLASAGWTVRRLVRRPAEGSDISWDPAAEQINPNELEDATAVIHLAGAPIAVRWTAANRQRILSSRVQGTRVLATALASLARPPEVFVSASAIGFYGPRDEHPVDEQTAAGVGFLAEVCQAWESAAEPARSAGIRVVHPRLGVVLARSGGALHKMLPAYRLGVGNAPGNGRAHFSWILLSDCVRALEHILETRALSGAVNLTAPGALPHRAFARALGRALRRPVFAPLPAFVVKTLFGSAMASETLLTGQNVVPRALLESGFTFEHPLIEAALAAALMDRSG